MEFDPREKAIVLTTSFLANSQAAQVPKDTLALGLQMMLISRDIKLDIVEITDMIDAIQNEQKESLKESFAFLDKNKKQFDGFKKLHHLFRKAPVQIINKNHHAKLFFIHRLFQLSHGIVIEG